MGTNFLFKNDFLLMNKFFDYVYYKICKAYSVTKDSSPEGAAFCVVALLQAFNIISILMLAEIVIGQKSILSLPVIIGLVIFFFIFNYIKYIYRDNNNYQVMKERWANESQTSTKGTLVVLYVIFSVLLVFGLVIYLGSKK